MIPLLVAVGAAVGAPLRHLTDRAARRRLPGVAFPVATLAVNVAASFLLGLLTGMSGAGPDTLALLGTGFCGALSTWSTLALETVDLATLGRTVLAGAYAVASIGAGVAVAALGWWLGR